MSDSEVGRLRAAATRALLLCCDECVVILREQLVREEMCLPPLMLETEERRAESR
jgi:hypothetical protein